MTTDTANASMNLGGGILIFSAALVTTLWPVLSKPRSPEQKKRIKEISLAVFLMLLMGTALVLEISGTARLLGVILSFLFAAISLFAFSIRKGPITRDEIVVEAVMPPMMFVLTSLMAFSSDLLGVIAHLKK